MVSIKRLIRIKMIKPFFVVTVGYYSRDSLVIAYRFNKKKKKHFRRRGFTTLFLKTYLRIGSYSFVQLSYANQFVLLSNCGATLCYDDGHLGAASPARPVFWRCYYFSKPLPNFNTK